MNIKLADFCLFFLYLNALSSWEYGIKVLGGGVHGNVSNGGVVQVGSNGGPHKHSLQIPQHTHEVTSRCRSYGVQDVPALFFERHLVALK